MKKLFNQKPQLHLFENRNDKIVINGIENLDPNLTINSITEKPILRYIGGVKLATSNELASFGYGKKLNLAGEISNTDLKDTTMFKALTGRSLVGAKRKFLSEIYFINKAKFIFACNELPMVYDLSRGFWDRWVLLEFPYTFVCKEELEENQDKKNLKLKDENIIEKITTPEELSGLLNEFLKGFDRLMKYKKFSSTKSSDEIKDLWIRKSNSFIAFCLSNIEEESDGMINKKELRKKYAKYCKLHKVPTKSDVVIKRVMQDSFGASEDEKNVATSGYQYEKFWVGVKWKN